MTTVCPCGNEIEHPESIGGQIVDCDGCRNKVILAQVPMRTVNGMLVTTPAKSRFVYIMLGLFFGFFGIHNLYAKRYAEATGQIVVMLLLGWMIFGIIINFIWVLIELFTVKTDNDGMPLN
jgi:TM2 domain-containing membrane protein YozV